MPLFLNGLFAIVLEVSCTFFAEVLLETQANVVAGKGANSDKMDLLAAFMHGVRLLAAEPNKLAAAAAAAGMPLVASVPYASAPLDLTKLSALLPTSSTATSAPESERSFVSANTTVDKNSNTRCSPDKAVSSPACISPLVATCTSSAANTFLTPNFSSPANSSVGPPLDTVLVAQTVRELLAANNIGQRLFAKHVLGLSQGTVSELLSKPKNWDKLTEKGRDSYRKMNSWSVEPHNIFKLKTLAPKKGQNYFTPPVVNKEDQATEERVNQILQEAKMAMSIKPEYAQDSQDVS